MFFKVFILVFVIVKTSTYKYDAFFFSNLRLAVFRSVTFSTFRFLQHQVYVFNSLNSEKITLRMRGTLSGGADSSDTVDSD